MATLLGVPPSELWKDLIRFANTNNGVDTTLRTIEDGKGTALPVQFSTTTANFTNMVTHEGRHMASSAGTTGGVGSAGAGTQFVQLTINGITYKVLHDGTV